MVNKSLTQVLYKIDTDWYTVDLILCNNTYNKYIDSVVIDYRVLSAAYITTRTITS